MVARIRCQAPGRGQRVPLPANYKSRPEAVVIIRDVELQKMASAPRKLSKPRGLHL
jgi:hypothetical protein